MRTENKPVSIDNYHFFEDNEPLIQELHRTQEELEHYLELVTAQEHKISKINRQLNALLSERNAKPTSYQRLTDWLGFTNHLRTYEVMISGFFDTTWYLQHYPDVQQKGVNPVNHYLKHGAKEGRNPSPHFDGNWYLSNYPDVAAKDINPLVHYIFHGKQEGRQASPNGCDSADPTVLERQWLQNARYEQANLAEQRRLEISTLTAERDEQKGVAEQRQVVLDELQKALTQLEQEKQGLEHKLNQISQASETEQHRIENQFREIRELLQEVPSALIR